MTDGIGETEMEIRKIVITGGLPNGKSGNTNLIKVEEI